MKLWLSVQGLHGAFQLLKISKAYHKTSFGVKEIMVSVYPTNGFKNSMLRRAMVSGSGSKLNTSVER